MSYFILFLQNYMEIPQIKQLSENVTEIKSQLATQIRADFEDAFQVGNHLGYECIFSNNREI